MKITKDAEKPSFTLTIDRNLITKADEGKFNLGIEAQDSAGKGSYSIPISISYIFVEKPEPEPEPEKEPVEVGGFGGF